MGRPDRMDKKTEWQTTCRAQGVSSEEMEMDWRAKRREGRSAGCIAGFMCVLAVVVLCDVASVSAQPKAEITDAEMGDWTKYYYRNPQPELAVPMLRAAARKGFLNEPYTRLLLAVFYGQVLAQAPAQLPVWLKALDSLSDTEQEVLLRGLWFSRNPDALKALNDLAGKASSVRKKLLDDMLKMEAPIVDKIEINSADVLDMLWSCFLATGEAKYVERIISTLAFAESKDHGKMVLVGAAVWSLRSNAIQHQEVFDICVQAAKTSDPVTSRSLKEILAKATEERKKGAPKAP